MFYASIKPEAVKKVEARVNELTGNYWMSYVKELNKLEERATELHGYGITNERVSCEVSGRYTLSGNPEFIYLDLEDFDFFPIEE